MIWRTSRRLSFPTKTSRANRRSFLARRSRTSNGKQHLEWGSTLLTVTLQNDVWLLDTEESRRSLPGRVTGTFAGHLFSQAFCTKLFTAKPVSTEVLHLRN